MQARKDFILRKSESNS